MLLPTVVAITAALLVMIVDSFAVRAVLTVGIFVIYIVAGRVLLKRKLRGAEGGTSGTENTPGRDR